MPESAIFLAEYGLSSTDESVSCSNNLSNSVSLPFPSLPLPLTPSKPKLSSRLIRSRPSGGPYPFPSKGRMTWTSSRLEEQKEISVG